MGRHETAARMLLFTVAERVRHDLTKRALARLPFVQGVGFTMMRSR
jgi:hypothetical protein